MLSDVRWCEDGLREWLTVLDEPLTAALFIVKKITNRGAVLLIDLSPGDGRMVCERYAFSHCFSSSGRDE